MYRWCQGANLLSASISRWRKLKSCDQQIGYRRTQLFKCESRSGRPCGASSRTWGFHGRGNQSGCPIRPRSSCVGLWQRTTARAGSRNSRRGPSIMVVRIPATRCFAPMRQAQGDLFHAEGNRTRHAEMCSDLQGPFQLTTCGDAPVAGSGRGG